MKKGVVLLLVLTLVGVVFSIEGWAESKYSDSNSGR